MVVLLNLAVLVLALWVAPIVEAEDKLSIPLHAAKVSLDPTSVQDQSSLWVARQVTCQLVRMRGGVVVNDAAESIRYKSVHEIEIALRPDVVFSDGSLVQALDVIETFAYLKDSRRVLRNVFPWIESMEASDSRHLTIRLKRAVPQFLRALAAPNYAIFKASLIKRAGLGPSNLKLRLGS